MATNPLGIASEVTKTLAATAERYLPEPAVTGIGAFGDVLDMVDQFTGDSVGGVSTSALGDFADLIQMQIEVQKEMQTTTMVSNVEKSKHESKMAPIRNIRTN